MNLAEIRKKAMRGETPEAALPEASAPAVPAPVEPMRAPAVEPDPFPALPELAAPEFSDADFPAEEFTAEEFTAEEFPAPEFFDPSPVPESRVLWQAGSPEYPMDDTGGFDPAAVILRGRESAAFELDEARQDEVAVASVELLCFRVGSEEYAIDIMDIKEIIKPREVTEVPRVPEFVRGILSLRGTIIPVFDMKVRLGLSGGEVSERERIVVVKRQGSFAGVLVDEVVQVVRIPEVGIEPPPVVLEGIDREFVLGIGRVSGRMLILLDMEKVLDVGLL